MKIKRIILCLSLSILGCLSAFQVYSNLFSTETSAAAEVEIGRSNTASWLGGYFFEYMTKEYLWENDSNDTVGYRIRYRLNHWGGGYTYQTGPVHLYVNGSHIATYNAHIGTQISNRDAVLGSTDITLSKGVNNTIEFRDPGGSGMTAINVRGIVFHALPTYTVTFNNGYGSNISSQTITKYQNASAPSISRTGYTFTGWAGTYTNVTSNRTVTATWTPNTYYVYYNANGGTGAPATQSFKFNSGAKISTQVPTRAGYTFTGWDYSGNNFSPGQAIPWDWGSFTLTAKWNLNTYTNTIAHWTGGYKYGEGTNSARNMKNIAITSFSAPYGSTINLGASKATTIPKGFYLSSAFGTPSITGSWSSYNIGTNTAQKANNMSFEYYYYPYDYSISYNLYGGKISGQPTTYTVLYAETLPIPSRDGYSFSGWTGSNGSTPQKNVTIAAGSTENKSYSATWNKIPTMSGTDFYVIEGSSLSSAQIIDGSVGYYRATDKNYPEKLLPGNFPIAARDVEDGNLSNQVIISKIMHEDGTITSTINTNKTGKYTVTYSVTDSSGNKKSLERMITVLPKSMPKLESIDRYFYKGTNITSSMLLEKTSATDKYDGDIKANIVISKNNINAMVTGEYEVVFKITNRSGNTVTKPIIVHIIDTVMDETDESYLRFIESPYINTLEDSSKWKTNTNLHSELLASFNKQNGDKEYVFNNKDIKDVKKFVTQNNFGVNLDGKIYNQMFYNLFKKCQVK